METFLTKMIYKLLLNHELVGCIAKCDRLINFSLSKVGQSKWCVVWCALVQVGNI